jgi:hypothetical protein
MLEMSRSVGLYFTICNVRVVRCSSIVVSYSVVNCSLEDAMLALSVSVCVGNILGRSHVQS